MNQRPGTKNDKDEKQNNEGDETLGAVAALKPKLHLDVTLMDKISKNLEPQDGTHSTSKFWCEPFPKSL